MTTNDGPAPAALDSPTDLLDALVQCSFVTMAALTRIGAEHDLSLTQLRVLGILRDRRLKMSRLADYLGLDRSTLSGLVERAERRDLLLRSANPDDGRAVDVALTATGLRFADQAQTQVAQALAPLTAALTGPDAARLTTLLRRLLGGSERD